MLFRFKRPSEWLRLDRAQLGLLAQSLRSIQLGGGGPGGGDRRSRTSRLRDK